jgi:cold shock CspA family protein
MGRSQETFGKKEVKSRNDKKRKEKEKKRSLRKTEGKKRSFDEMIAYVDEFGKISSTPPDPDKKTIVDPDSIELTATRNKPVSGPSEERKGVVTFFGESKGFGFIKDSQSGEEIFVHISNVTEQIKEGDRVEFSIGKGPRGATAIKVKLIKE